MSNYKRKIVAAAFALALAAGFAGVAASSVDDGAKANGLRIVQNANGLK